jgi:glutathione S-transferase
MDSDDERLLTVWGIGTTRTFRVHWMAAELGLDYETRPVRTRSAEVQEPEYLALNPRAKIPTLCHGNLVLTESAAILGYLADAFPVPEGFFVADGPVQCARHAEWCAFALSELDAHSLYVMRRHDALQDIYGAAPEAVASAREYFLKQVNATDCRIAQPGPYLMGAPFSAADILLTSCLDWAHVYDIPLPERAAAYRTRVNARPAYQRALRINFPERFEAGA